MSNPFDDPAFGKQANPFDDPSFAPKGALAYIATQAKKGLTADLPSIAGKALQYTGEPGDTVHDVGTRMRQYGEASAAEAPPEEERNPIVKTVASTLRGAAPIVPLAAGGIVANLAAPEIAVPLELAGAAGAAGLFGGAQGQDTLEKARREGLAEPAAKDLARQTAGITGVGMGAVGALTGGIASPLLRGVAGVGAKSAAELVAKEAAPGFVRPLVADTAGNLVGNAASMAAANAGVAHAEQSAGLSGPTPGEAAVEGLESGAGLTAALLPFGAIRTKLAQSANRVAVARLQDGTAEPQQRAQVAARIHANLMALDPEAAKQFALNAQDAINNRQTFALDESVLRAKETPPSEPSTPSQTVPQESTPQLHADFPQGAEPVSAPHPEDLAALEAARQPDAGPLAQAAGLAVETGATQAPRFERQMQAAAEATKQADMDAAQAKRSSQQATQRAREQQQLLEESRLPAQEYDAQVAAKMAAPEGETAMQRAFRLAQEKAHDTGAIPTEPQSVARVSGAEPPAGKDLPAAAGGEKALGPDAGAVPGVPEHQTDEGVGHGAVGGTARDERVAGTEQTAGMPAGAEGKVAKEQAGKPRTLLAERSTPVPQEAGKTQSPASDVGKQGAQNAVSSDRPEQVASSAQADAMPTAQSSLPTPVVRPSLTSIDTESIAYPTALAAASARKKLEQKDTHNVVKQGDRFVLQERPRLTLDDTQKGDLDSVKSELGYAERGGHLLRDTTQATAAEREGEPARFGVGPVVGRTKWIPYSDLWPGRPDKAVNEPAARRALDKAAKGEHLAPEEHRFVSYALDYAEKRRAETEQSGYNELSAQYHAAVDEIAAAIPWDAVKTDSWQDLGRALGATEEEIHAIETATREREKEVPTTQPAGAESDSGDTRPALALAAQSETKLAARDEQRQAAARDAAEAARVADERAAADRQRADYALTGSDRKADENPNQTGLFNRSEKPFYSELSRQIQTNKQESMPAGMWKGYLEGLKNKGVKPDEIEFSGVKDWLDLQQGKVTKAQVLYYLKQNGVRVEETELGGDNVAKMPPDIVHVNGYGHFNLSLLTTQERQRFVALEGFAADGNLSSAERNEWKALTEKARATQDQADAQRDAYFGAGDTKFASHQLPGGENYRELLLTLPTEARSISDEPRTAAEYIRAMDAQKTADAGKVFRSPHFDQPNILAHIRFNERTDAQGKKVLFIEEIQSDWAQKGKREGFALPPEKTAPMDSEYRALVHKNADARDAGREPLARDVARAQELEAALDRADTSSVPSAPFVGRTDAWVSLALKRMIRYAVDNGFDRVAWTNGEQQAARYDLSKHIKDLTLHGTGDNLYISATDHADRKVINMQPTTRPGLADFVGKEAAEKLLSQPEPYTGNPYASRHLFGVDLKVGGEGMKAFYDKIVPNVANDVLKKLGGGRVGEIEFHGRFKVEQGNDGWGYTDEGGGGESGFATRAEAQAAAQRDNAHEGSSSIGRQPSFDITPALKARVEGGMPLFRRGGDFSGRAFDAELYADTLRAKSAQDVLSKIATKSTDPFNREVAKRLLATGIDPTLSTGIPKEFAGEVGNERYGNATAGFFPNQGGKQGMVSLFRAGNAEKNLLHEFAHAATYHAIEKKTLAGRQMQRLYEFVKALGKVHQDSYGLADVHEFTAETFSNQSFRNVLSRIDARNAFGQRSYVKTAWDAFVDVLRKILGLPAERHDALAQALKIGGDVMRANERVVAGGALYNRPAVFNRDGVVEMPEHEAPKGQPEWVSKTDAVTQEFLRKAGVWVQQKPIKERLKEWKHEAGLKILQGTVDQFAPVLKKIGEYPYQVLRMSSAYDAGLEASMYGGHLRMTDQGALALKSGTRGLLEILKPLKGEQDRFLAWYAANRAFGIKERSELAGSQLQEVKAELTQWKDRERKAIDEGNELPYVKTTRDEIDAREKTISQLEKQANITERNFSDEEMAKGKRLNTKLHDTDNFSDGADGTRRAMVYAQVSKEFDAFGKSILDIGEKAGLFNAEQRAMWERSWYVPFFREQEGKVEGPRNLSGMVNQVAFKQLKGGTEGLHDLLANTLQNWGHILSASLKNNAARVTLEKAKELGIAHEAPAGEEGAVYILKDGAKVHYVVDDPLVLDSLRSLEQTPFRGPAMKALTWFKHALTVGTTASPVFRLRHTIREQITALAANPTTYNFVQNWIDGFKYSSRNNPEYYNMLAGGSFFRMGQNLEADRGAYVKRLIKAGVDESTILDSPNKVKAALEQAWDWWKETGERSDSITRANLYRQTYDRLIAAGKSPDEAHFTASYTARDAMDYGLHGTWPAIRIITQLVPFMNARAQGLYKLGRGARDDPKRFAAVVGGITFATIALSLAYRNDPDMQKREEWDRDNNWAFRIGDKLFRIPKPFELGAIGTVVDRALETVLNGFDPESRERFVKQLWPIIGSQLNMNPVPQVIYPVLELWANKDVFTGRGIESQRDQKLTPDQRIGPNTTATAQLLGKAGVLSPEQIDFLVNAYLGWVGSHAVATADLALRPMMGLPNKPAPRVDDYFLVGDFVKQLPSNQSRFVEQFYDHLKDVQQAFGDMRNFQKTGQAEKAMEIMRERGDDIRLHQLYLHTQREIGQVNQRIRYVQMRNMDAGEKREEIDRLTQLKDRLAETAETSRTRAAASR